MKPYVFLAIGTIWLIIAIVLYRTDFVFAVFVWRGNRDPTLTLSLFRVLLPVLFFGWVAPALFGSWLLRRK